ncbi:glycosyltransferase family 2 protein [Acidobacteria bacterium ACD]|nr:MAG: glycosyltransferase family 2 protein [Acidobacteriota bacterium]MCE7958334.1 glycosyltransferase family 2 protein [Acidobacteria bacterium ACB2]MDL1951592.1 glycosyltransferase family 2 protein [Acidobacteria bacterium ACD]
MRHGKKVAVVMPAYNAEETLVRSYEEIPHEFVDDIVLVDDGSKDRTVELARSLPNVHVVVHERNKGYGGNQKTCYRTALARGADICVMIHPDHQYDASVLPDLIEPIALGKADAMFGSRMLGGRPIEGGMPKWKYLANIGLTAVENATFYLYLTEYHSGLRAYSRRYLETVALDAFSDDFVFDTQIIAAGIWKKMTIREIPIVTRYFDEASQIDFRRSCVYGLEILWTMLRFKLHKWGYRNDPLFR